MAEIKVDLEVLCECGKDLTVSKNTWAGQIIISPCQSCLEDKYDEGIRDGIKSRED
jgi:hypothetical protein